MCPMAHICEAVGCNQPSGRIVEIYNPTIPYEMRRWHLCIEHTVQTVASVDGVTGTHKGPIAESIPPGV